MKNPVRINRWSPVLLSAAFALAGCSTAPADGPGYGSGKAPDQTAAGWFGGYLDVTLPPGPTPQPAASGGTVTVLAFITADPEKPCEAAWGGRLSLDQAGTMLQLDSRIQQLRADGHDIAVSFGGQRGQELATVCGDVEALAKAYGAVVERYGLDVLDLDVEGRAAAPAAAQARAAAMARLQAERPKERPLQIWLTLPAGRDGLEEDGRNSVQAMLAAGVELAGVNIMTMNFGPLGKGESMFSASVEAAQATHQVLGQLYTAAGKPADAGTTWRRIGLTPMIGDNDVEGNTFSLEDAAGLNLFAMEKQVGRMSFWSINRDAGCGTAPPEERNKRPSIYCSGIDQDPGEFAAVLGNAFTGGR